MAFKFNILIILILHHWVSVICLGKVGSMNMIQVSNLIPVRV